MVWVIAKRGRGAKRTWWSIEKYDPRSNYVRVISVRKL